MEVRHIRATSSFERDRMRTSKYVQSSIGYTFRDIKLDLENNKYVLFTGTPCQCEGLKKYLQNDYKKLFMMDFPCKGIPSQKVYYDFLKFAQNHVSGRITGLNFRDKNEYQYNRQPIFGRRLIFYINNGADIIYDEKINWHFHDPFFLGAFQMEACNSCKFHSLRRCTDYTCGDFHRHKFNDKYDDGLGISVFMINSEKGKELLQNNPSKNFFLKVKREDCAQPVLKEGEVSRWFFYDFFWNIYSIFGFRIATWVAIPHIIFVKIKRKVFGIYIWAKKIIS